MAKTAVALRPKNPPAPAQTDGQALLAMIERVARDPKSDVAKVERLLAVRNEDIQRVAKQAFNVAMVACQDGMLPVRKNMKADRFKFASLEAVDEALRPVYSHHGFGLTFNSQPMPETNRILVICDVLHRDGFEKRYTVPMTASPKGPKGGDVMTQTQAEGAAISFGRRYLELMIFNIITTEDDAAVAPEGASQIGPETLADLKQKIEAAGLPMDKFELAFGPINDLPVSRLDEALSRIDQYKKRGFRKDDKEAKRGAS